MKTIELKKILEKKDYPEAGSILYNYIKEAISASDKIEIDMRDAISVPTMFMNTSFGVIIEEFGEEKFKSSIIFRHISKSQIERIKKYLSDYSKVNNK